MARPLRIQFENAVYHVTAQGDRKEKIFLTEQDKIIFINKLNEVFTRYQVVCYSYCLMNNHYHLFIRTPLGNLSRVMQSLNSSYSSWFIAKYRIHGHVFRGRYHSVIVDTDAYAIILSSYIHLNPVRARLVKQPEDYRWSSLRDILQLRSPLVKALDPDFILNYFSNDTNVASKTFLTYQKENLRLKDIRSNINEGLVLGDDKFKEEIKAKISLPAPDSEIPLSRSIGKITANRILDYICSMYRTDISSIINNKSNIELKKTAIYLIRKRTALTEKEIGEIFNASNHSICKIVKRFENQLSRKPVLKEVIDTIENDLE